MTFFDELKRRNVFKVGAAYAIVAWLIVQVVVSIEAPLGLPDWVDAFFIVMLAAGFPVAALLAWAYEVTPEGVKPTAEVDRERSITRTTGQRLNYAIIGLLAVAVTFLVVDNYLIGDSQEAMPNSIAVLPFANLSPDPENASFASGIHETILSQLANIADLTVISRTSMLKYAEGSVSIPEVARELKVEMVMEGSVQFAEGRVLVTTQLIDPATEAHIWSGNYDREFKDIFLIQADIAKRIAAALEVKLLPVELASIDRPLTASPEAYQWYLKELDLPYFEEYPDTKPTHVAYLDQATALDPEFAAAFARKAMAFTGDSGQQQAARENAERAIALDPSLGLGHMALAWIETAAGNYVAARASYEQALKASPNDAKILIEAARFWGQNGELADGIRMAERALEIAPNSYDVYVLYGQVLLQGGDTEGASASFRRATEIGPAFAGSFVQLAVTQIALGDFDAAQASLERAETLWSAPPGWGLAWLAYANGRLGRREQAQRYVERLEAVPGNESQIVDPIERLLADLALADRDEARSVLTEMAANCSDCRAAKATLNVLNDPILDEPEFAELRERIGAE